MKKTILLLIILIISNTVYAADELEIKLVAYDSETQSAQISIKNIGTQDYHDIMVALDNLPESKVVNRIKAGVAIKIPKGIPPGVHTITVSAAEGIKVSKKIDFPVSKQIREQQVEAEKELQELTKKEEETTKAYRTYETTKKTNYLPYMVGLGVILLIIILFLIFKRKHTQNYPQNYRR